MGHKTYLRRNKSLYERLESVYFVNFDQFLAPGSGIQEIQINAAP